MNNNNPIVSVIISTHNRENKIGATIESVLNQTYQNFEIIIVDDASTDDTVSLLEEMTQKDPRISFYVLEKNSGGAAAPKNKALEHARGKYIATLDSDDLWYPEKLEKQLELFKKYPDVEVVGCAFKNMRDGGDEIQFIPEVNHRNAILVKDYMGPGSCMIYKKSLLEKTGGFDPEFKNFQDWDMRIRIQKYSDFAFVNEPLLDYVVDAKSISNRSRFKTDYYLRKITKKHISVLVQNPKEFGLHFFYLIIRHLLTLLRLNYVWLFVRNKVLKNKVF